MDSPTLTSGLLRIRERPGIRADVGFSPHYISCLGLATIAQRHTRQVVRDTAPLNRAGQTAMNGLLLFHAGLFRAVPRQNVVRLSILNSERALPITKCG